MIKHICECVVYRKVGLRNELQWAFQRAVKVISMGHISASRDANLRFSSDWAPGLGQTSQFMCMLPLVLCTTSIIAGIFFWSRGASQSKAFTGI